MTLFPQLQARLFASEPMVRQPVAIEFDDRGRLWVIQYLQYPNPAGLKRVKVDRYSRTVYDHVPEPPPHGPRGADRITILEDRDHDGTADSAHDFLDGLNLASGLAFGNGGVYVLQVPYLLFYPDRNHDDRPDSDPEVLLSGFGMEDAHSVANSLTWGPDGWLYGLQGSTVTANIRGITFQQGVWRYHPPTQRFELFSEGGGNMWGLDFDRQGQLFASTNVGGSVLLHAVQGGYYWKSFGKHGALHNPFTFGYFEHVPHAAVRGGHVAVGGLFYEADAFPESLRGKYLAADLLDHSAHYHTLSPRGSTFEARQEGDWLRSNDTWFAPSDMTLGPEGAVYVADWHDQRTAHPDPDADWDRSNGRIFRIERTAARPGPAPDLPKLDTAGLVAMLDHPNVWYVRRARRLLAERRDPRALPMLRLRLLDTPSARPRLEALWALYGCGGLDGTLARRLLDDPDAALRAWTVRLLGDAPALEPALASRLVALARTEPSVIVRAQLASTAQRIPPEHGLAIAQAILVRNEDAADPYLPLLLWWAVERHAIVARERTLQLFTSDAAWKSSFACQTVLGRLVQRYAAEGGPAGDEACVRILQAARSEQDRRLVLEACEQGLNGRLPATQAPALRDELRCRWKAQPDDLSLLRLACRTGSAEAADQTIRLASDPKSPVATRLALLELLASVQAPSSFDAMLALIAGEEPEAIQVAAFNVLSRAKDDRIPGAVLDLYSRRSAAWRARARDLLVGRVSWASRLLDAVDSGTIPVADVTLEQAGRIALLHNEGLATRVRQHWGTIKGPTPEGRLAEVRRLNNDLRAGPGDPARGHTLFRDRCATCHRLFGEGEKIGPDLTYANRKDRDAMLVSLVDPSGVIRKEYQAVIVQMRDGQVLSGLIVEQSAETVTLFDAQRGRTTVPRRSIEEISESPVSLMPDNLYREFAPAQLRDLFAYLQSDGPLPEGATR